MPLPTESEVGHYEWSCQRKRAYQFRKHALNRIQMANKQKFNRLQGCKPYQCKFCKMWHIGHPPKKNGR